MKKLLLILVLFSSLTMLAQKNKKDHIKSLKVAYITEKLNLSSKEAQEFWPIYNTYEDNRSKIKHEEIRSIRNEIKSNFEAMTDEDAQVLIDKLNDSEIKLHELEMDFSKELSKILPPKKIILLKVSEEDFKRKMFEEFKKRRKEKS
ncbi:sensor of ECF-type sigma factor [Tamlana sp. 2_MG-2023]|uniref:sensor of ECF-type sigma factor n=1 Tax=unclassified Tamlana TaxID=2614803 RepID=UPI0026E34BF0|nr:MULTISPECIES: sensor of ECF-type sigma factor [unclassified Tamlana]MDO6760077.1 sensor of ECF-type sigma factor [Tamlana sp. 2_MG-2023]MDO6790225.1 sensor of ECF-type sigma factor [Tamlana sp. 1_MG-2023]